MRAQSLFITTNTRTWISDDSRLFSFFEVHQWTIAQSAKFQGGRGIILNSTEMSGNNTHEMITISSISSPGSQVVTIDSDSKEPTMPYGFGRQLASIPPSVNDLNLPLNPFNIPATMATANPTAEGHDENYSPQSPEPSEPSPISAQLRDGRHLTRRWMLIHSTPLMIPGEFIFYPQVPRHRSHPESWKENWALEGPSQKERECRSTSARLVDSRFLNRRT